MADEITRGGVTHGKLSQAVVALETSSAELRAARAALTRSENAREQLEKTLEAERQESRQLSASGLGKMSRHNPLLWPWRGAGGGDDQDEETAANEANSPLKAADLAASATDKEVAEDMAEEVAAAASATNLILLQTQRDALQEQLAACRRDLESLRDEATAARRQEAEGAAAIAAMERQMHRLATKLEAETRVVVLLKEEVSRNEALQLTADAELGRRLRAASEREGDARIAVSRRQCSSHTARASYRPGARSTMPRARVPCRSPFPPSGSRARSSGARPGW